MTYAYVTLRTRAAEELEGHPAILRFRPTRLDGRVHFAGTTLEHDFSSNQEVRVWLTSSTLPVRVLPVQEVNLRRHGMIGVRIDGSADSSRFYVHFLGPSGPLTSRQVDWNGSVYWADPPDDTTGLAFSIVAQSAGQVALRAIEVILPPHTGPVPGGETLLQDLRTARFPSPPTAWPLRRQIAIGKNRATINGEEFQLNPADWTEVPLLSRTHQLLIHGFSFAESLMAHPGGVVCLGDLLLSWADSHPERPHSTTQMAWNDMAVAKRTMAILMALDRARFETTRLAAPLSDLLSQHASWLAHPRNYLAGHDHGLYSDTALEFAARALSMHPLADSWATLARLRFASTAAKVINEREGTVLEHSPAYIEAVADLISERRREGLRDELEPNIVERFDTTLRSLTMPDGSLIPWGDTALDHPGKGHMGCGVAGFPSTGWAVSHHSDSAAGLVASYHSVAHKHADELSLVYYDQTGPIIFEAGLPGYEYGGENRTYAESGRAHSGSHLEGVSSDWRANPPYGSAAAPPAVSGNWHLLMAWNPLLEAARHQRFVFHHPLMVVVVDLISGQMIRGVTRLLHVAPGKEIEILGGAEARIGRHFLTLFSTGQPARFNTHQTLHFPDMRSFREHTLVEIVDRGPGTKIFILSTGTAVKAADASVLGDPDHIQITVRLENGTRLIGTARPATTPTQLDLEVSTD